eukprot:148333-Rhodomonas_salina.2
MVSPAGLEETRPPGAVMLSTKLSMPISGWTGTNPFLRLTLRLYSLYGSSLAPLASMNRMLPSAAFQVADD